MQDSTMGFTGLYGTEYLYERGGGFGGVCCMMAAGVVGAVGEAGVEA